MDTHTVQYKVRERTLQVYTNGQVVNFDRTGRFKMLSSRHRTVRRGLDHRMVEVTDSGEDSHSRTYKELDMRTKTGFLEDMYRIVHPSSSIGLDATTAQWLKRVQNWNPERLAQDQAQFRSIYLPVSILPPGEYQSVVVQLTEGCSYNRCVFCDFYRDRPFHIKNESELQQHLSKIRSFFAESLQDRSGVFLGDGNALVVPFARLLRAFEQIHRELGSVAVRFATFMDTFNIQRKSKAELVALRDAGLDMVYVGLESGQDEMRKFLNKPGTAEEALAAISYLKEAGLRVSPIVMAGIGDQRSRAHHLETTELLKRAPLDENDIVFVSPFIEPPNHLYSDALKARDWVPFSDTESNADAMRWMEVLRHELSAKVALYSILEHLY
ncbi:radical SAM protein [Alicyclobacillus sp. SO9]|uniref:radical SAM protein n=1 Tax=Alicyclobacillus sp. SO9 TaxID=2665646 RepID=UPI0018E80680|nr:radical SAM protein [Alicyclobacillus sp. SO9]QQE77685.1 radical SAM protein [Alicyclobacillus sp. SO9]